MGVGTAAEPQVLLSLLSLALQSGYLNPLFGEIFVFPAAELWEGLCDSFLRVPPGTHPF